MTGHLTTIISPLVATPLHTLQVKGDMLQSGHDVGFAKIEQDNPWLTNTALVVKPDQLIKRRGKAGLLAVNKTWQQVKAWITERMGKEQKVCILAVHRALSGGTVFRVTLPTTSSERVAGFAMYQ